METADVRTHFNMLASRQDLDTYNFAHFRTEHLLNDFKRTATDRGIQPGEMAPDFDLPDVDGGMFRLSEQRGKLLLLRFGSLS